MPRTRYPFDIMRAIILQCLKRTHDITVYDPQFLQNAALFPKASVAACPSKILTYCSEPPAQNNFKFPPPLSPSLPNVEFA